LSDEHVVIVGAGHGGGALAAQLRNDGHAGPITLVGSERVHPYQRPPLSKAWLSGEVDEAALALRPAAFYAERGITLRLGETVAALELAGRRVLLESGEAIGFDRLVLATGARARRLEVAGAELGGVVSLRDAADASRLRACLTPGGRIAIVGGGYIGLEVAASARKLGVEAVVIEREARLLARVACRTLSDFYELLHRAHGVRFHFSASLAAIG
jgi:3-phenylpropionate/trans-cinnamate dioxygenase ferredoxin reductase subunit